MSCMKGVPVRSVVAKGGARKGASQKRQIIRRKYPVGAEVQQGGGVHFRVWAPKSPSAAIEFEASLSPLQPEPKGYFSGFVPKARAGSLYKIELDSGSYPDPVSRFQPEGPHGPSQVVDPAVYKWKDNGWKGVTRRGQVIY